MIVTLGSAFSEMVRCHLPKAEDLKVCKKIGHGFTVLV